MIDTLIAKGLTLWLEISILIWMGFYKDTIIKFIKELLGGFGGKKPTDDDTPKEDK